MNLNHYILLKNCLFANCQHIFLVFFLVGWFFNFDGISWDKYPDFFFSFFVKMKKKKKHLVQTLSFASPHNSNQMACNNTSYNLITHPVRLTMSTAATVETIKILEEVPR